MWIDGCITTHSLCVVMQPIAYRCTAFTSWVAGPSSTVNTWLTTRRTISIWKLWRVADVFIVESVFHFLDRDKMVHYTDLMVFVAPNQDEGTGHRPGRPAGAGAAWKVPGSNSILMANKVPNWFKQDVEGMIIIKVFSNSNARLHGHSLHIYMSTRNKRI